MRCGDCVEFLVAGWSLLFFGFLFCFVLFFCGGRGDPWRPYLLYKYLRSPFLAHLNNGSLYPGAPSFLFWETSQFGYAFRYISCFWIYNFPYVLVVIVIFTLLCIFTIHYVYFIWCLRFVVSSRFAGECSLLQLIDRFHFL